MQRRSVTYEEIHRDLPKILIHVMESYGMVTYDSKSAKLCPSPELAGELDRRSGGRPIKRIRKAVRLLAPRADRLDAKALQYGIGSTFDFGGPAPQAEDVFTNRTVCGLLSQMDACRIGGSGRRACGRRMTSRWTSQRRDRY